MFAIVVCLVFVSYESNQIRFWLYGVIFNHPKPGNDISQGTSYRLSGENH